MRTASARAAVILAILAAMTFSASAYAGASVEWFLGAHSATFQAPLEGCLPADLIGTVTVTETSSGQVVETASGRLVIHGTNEYDYRLILPDGRFVQSGLNRDRYVIVSNGRSTVFNLVGQDFRTIFAADGTPTGYLTVHAGFHTTYEDRNGDGIADPGELSAAVDWVRISCR
jgi:hypothetical protein